MASANPRVRKRIAASKGVGLPDFSFEKTLWQRGFACIAGCDEVGRGCFAGPVVAGCVVFPPHILNSKFKFPVRINDSKKLTALQRQNATVWIKDNALTWGIGESSASLINRIGMAKATKRAFRLAIKNSSSKILNLNSRIDFLLIDAFYLPYTKGLRRKNQKAIVHGDEKSFSIASASILAKVYRDELMMRIGLRSHYKKYDWPNNKGYGSKKHQKAILKYGITGYHRKQFVSTFLKKKDLFFELQSK